MTRTFAIALTVVVLCPVQYAHSHPSSLPTNLLQHRMIAGSSH
jgi:hypothetical protein